MAQKQIPEYTDSQLLRELDRVGRKPILGAKFENTEEGRESWKYFKELVNEQKRREKIYGHELRHSQGFTLNVPRGSRLNVERVA